MDTLASSSASTPRSPIIASSWKRSALCGVHPDDAPALTDADMAAADPLLDAARPVLDSAATQLADTGTSLLLVDHECRMVSRVAFGTAVERSLDALGAQVGVGFGEDVVGTSALGTPAEIRGGIAVNGTEHYLERLKHMSCFGMPIVHPTTRRLAGSLCMTEVADHINPLALPLVKGIVADIADRLLDRSRAHQRQVLAAFQRAAGRRDIAIAAVGEDLQLANARAAELLAATDIGALRALAADPGLSETTLRMSLASGTEVDVVVEPIAGTVGAALFRLRPLAPQAATSQPLLTPMATAPTSVAVVGEPGTGRSTVARRLAGELFSTTAAADRTPPLIVDITDELIAGRRPEVTALVASCRRQARALILDGVELLDDTSLALLGRAAALSTPMIVVSGPAEDAHPAVGSLIARCARRVDVAALRHRGTELGVIATDILTAIDPRLSLSSSATDALLCQEWPGNLTELTSVLRQAAETRLTRGGRVVDVDALPARYRTTSRAAHLSGREQAERQAIIDALEHCERNKAHAAKELGISRTTLYARIRALGI